MLKENKKQYKNISVKVIALLRFMKLVEGKVALPLKG
jgi:hypothetical protein